MGESVGGYREFHGFTTHSNADNPYLLRVFLGDVLRRRRVNNPPMLLYKSQLEIAEETV